MTFDQIEQPQPTSDFEIAKISAWCRKHGYTCHVSLRGQLELRKKAVLWHSCSHDGASYVALIVIVEATKSAQEDLKSIIDGVRLINHNKEHFRIR
jgi:hypothetical protein